MAAKFFPLMDVADMNFYRRQLNGFQGVQNGHTIMGIGAGIDYDPIFIAIGFLNPVYQLPFRITLFDFYFQVKTLRRFAKISAKFFVGFAAVDSFFTDSQQIQVRPVQYQNFFHTAPPVYFVLYVFLLYAS